MARKKMLVICPFPVGVAAGQRLKYEQYFDDWREMGFDITVSSYADIAMWSKLYVRGHYGAKLLGLLRGHARRIRDLFRVHRFDIVYIHMWVTPFGTSLFERLIRKLGRRIVFDIEDNLLIGHETEKRNDPNPLLRLVKGPGKARYLIAEADHVISSSPFLNETCERLNRKGHATYISSSVETDRFLPVNGYSGTEDVTVGWTGTHSTREYLDLLRGAFQTLSGRVRFRLRVIGNFDYDLPGVPLDVVRWTREREVEDLQAIDIGVYPLPLDDWVTGKSGLKAIQYMAFGLPVVASAVGMTPRIVRDGETGLLVRTEAEWVEALEALIRDPARRRRLGEAGRRDAVAKYSTKAVAADYRRVLESVMGNRNG